MTFVKIGVITVPINKAGNPPLSHLMNILDVYSKDLYLLTGNDGYTLFKQDSRFHVEGWVYQNHSDSFLSRLSRYFWTQIFISYRIILQRKNVDLWIFFIGGYRLHLPIMVAKLFHKEVVLLLADSGGKHPGSSQDVEFSLPKILVNFPYSYADKIVVYSPRLIHFWGLESYQNKTLIAHEHFLNFKTFKNKTEYKDRQPLIGYIGRISKEKGVQNFVEALPAVRAIYPDLSILIGGDGPLTDEIKTYVLKEKLIDHVELPGWISHQELPDYLNRLRLLVIPSYTEGLPNILLEALACGTPVLATPVGAIPDIIRDGETGFIMESHTPECIAAGIIRAISSPDLDKIIENGRLFVYENYQFEKTVETWRRILEETGQDTI